MCKEGSKDSPEKVVQEIRRKTRRRFLAEEKIRIVLEGLDEESLAGSHDRLQHRHSTSDIKEELCQT